MDDLKKHISKLREDFMLGKLDEKDVERNPFIQFEKWLKEAVVADVPEVQAMHLSTGSENNTPSSRIVYLREFSDNAFVFYGNYKSQKGRELEHNKNASLNFFWPQLERQIRITGIVEKASAETSDAYFNTRPPDSQIGAWASNQSHHLSSRKELEEAIIHFENLFQDKKIQRPPHWGGWILKANYYEFWQGRKSRLHDRISYSLTETSWKINRLAP